MSGGDEARFRELYDRMYNRLWAFVLRRLPDEHAARDVVSETFMAVWRRMPDVPRDAAGAEAWVFRTARNVLANSERSEKRRGRLFDRIRQRPVDLYVDVLASAESNEAVVRALEQIRPAEREILALAFWDDLDTEQIARVLGCSKNAAAVRLTRARQAWQAAFESVSATDAVVDESPDERRGVRDE